MRHSRSNRSLLLWQRLGVTSLAVSLAMALPVWAQSQDQRQGRPQFPSVSAPVLVPVQAAAYQYQDGNFKAIAQIDPLAGRLLGRLVSKEVPSSVTLSATELAGAFAIPAAAASLDGGRLTLDSRPVKVFLEPYLQQVLGQVAKTYPLPEGVGIETLETVFNYRFTGQGALQTLSSGGQPVSTAFTFDYSDSGDRLTLQGLNPAVLAQCQGQPCQTQLDGDFVFKIDIQGLSQVSGQLGIQLPSSARQALNQARLFGLKEVDFADGQLTAAVQVQPAPTLTGLGSLPPVARPQSGDRFPPQDTSKLTPKLTHGNFVLTAERLTAPWSAVFSVAPPGNVPPSLPSDRYNWQP